MITSFGDRRSEDLFHGRSTNRTRRIPSELATATLRKFDMLNAATVIGDLRSPPSNRLEALRGDLTGFYNIRVNDQWRVIFKWSAGEASEVQLIDYH